ncbi:hypothetical protein V1515DRAFT_614495 [Lipomyces mesembrius]
MTTSSMLKRRQNYLHQADADSKCRCSIGITSRRALLVAASPPPTSIAQLSEYMQQVKSTDSSLATDPVTRGSDTDLDSIFDSDETYTDSSPPESPSCEPWIADYFDSENESGQPHQRVDRFCDHASKMVEPLPERPPTLKPVDDKNSVHSLLLPTPSSSTRKAANTDIISADVVEATNIVEPQRADENKLEMPLTHFAQLLNEGIPEGISSSQIYASISGFMFRHLDTTPGLRHVFRTRDHRRGSKYMKEEVKVMYDTITRHRSLGCDDRFIVDLVVLAVYSWRVIDKRAK